MYKVIGADQKEYGPISAQQLRQWIAEGRANAATMIRPEGATEWKPLSAFPEFSTAAAPSPFAPSTIAPTRIEMPHTNGLAVTGMIMGILSLVTPWCCCLGLIFPILGIIFSCIGLSQINRNPEVEKGRGMAIAGLVMSVLAIVLYVLAILIFGFASMTQNLQRMH